MQNNYQLVHPEGKSTPRINADKYDLLKKEIQLFLFKQTMATFGQLNEAIKASLLAQKIPFEGSITWHLEWVKLDMEAKKQIIRNRNKSPHQYQLSNAD